MQFACLPCVVAVLCIFALGMRVFFPRGLADREAPTAQVASIGSSDERKVRVVAFTASSFMWCFSAEQLLDTCT